MTDGCSCSSSSDEIISDSPADKIRHLFISIFIPREEACVKKRVGGIETGEGEISLNEKEGGEEVN